jgi:hypothetical protein
MFRSKILGQASFNQAMTVMPSSVNSDMGHFSIGAFDLITPVFEDVPMPPKHLWIRVKVHFELCADTPVFRGSDSFIWSGQGRCQSVKLENAQILYAQKDCEIGKCWTLSKEQKTYEHRFAVAPTLYGKNEGIHLWPCGAFVVNVLEIEQLFAQVAFDERDVFVNSLSRWKKHLVDGDEVVFEPLLVNAPSLISAINTGKISWVIEQQGVQFCFSSCRVEATDTINFIDILCERNDL